MSARDAAGPDGGLGLASHASIVKLPDLLLAPTLYSGPGAIDARSGAGEPCPLRVGAGPGRTGIVEDLVNRSADPVDPRGENDPGNPSWRPQVGFK